MVGVVDTSAYFAVANNNRKTVVTSIATINTTAWNFIVLEWKVVVGGLQCTLYLNELGNNTKVKVATQNPITNNYEAM